MSGSSDLFGNDPSDYSTEGAGSVQGLVNASVGINAGWSFDQPKAADTANSDAIQSMTPTTASASAQDSAWGGFWRGVVGSVVQTGTAVVAKQNGLIQPATTTPAVVPPPNPNRTLLLVAAVVGVVLLATRKG